jgi:hypothetical protein
MLARLLCAAGSFATAVYVCIATGSPVTSVAIYILSVAAAALTLRGMGWRLVPALPRAVADPRAWLGRRLRHGTPRAAEARGRRGR